MRVCCCERPCQRHKILVIGAGVVGLSSALNIQETCRDVTVTLMADKFSPNTTSDIAAGLWEVLETEQGDQALLLQLSKDKYEYMRDMARSPLASITGAQTVLSYKLHDEKMTTEPHFKDVLDGYRRLSSKESARMVLEAKDGFIFETLTIDVSRYLKWLTDKFLSNGGRLVQRKLQSLEDLSSEWDVIVNCTGLGSRELLQDTKLYPARGQVFRVRAPWIKYSLIYETSDGKATYVLPNTDSVVVGGTYQIDDWNASVSKEDSRDIWNRAVKVMPCLQNAEILAERVGHRPCREHLRLETEIKEIENGKRKIKIVHNYGHGGRGISVHWACAKKAADMVSQLIQGKDHESQRQHRSKL